MLLGNRLGTNVRPSVLKPSSLKQKLLDQPCRGISLSNARNFPSLNTVALLQPATKPITTHAM